MHDLDRKVYANGVADAPMSRKSHVKTIACRDAGLAADSASAVAIRRPAVEKVLRLP